MNPGQEPVGAERLVARFTALWLRGERPDPREFAARAGVHDLAVIDQLVEAASILRGAEASGADASEPSALPRPGDTLGPFRIVRTLGSGGMGTVFEADDVPNARRVALKLLDPEFRASAEAEERFRREARIGASLRHEACVFVYGVHEFGHQLAISMELVDGGTLADEVERGPIAIDVAVRWTQQVLGALESAHATGVVHRDVKPSNCFLSTEGQVRVGDFGLSRLADARTEVTAHGRFLGSPLYASPEQVLGRSVDPRSDIYSAAATLYALLTGRPPHPGRQLVEVLASILSDPPSRLRSIRPDVPRALEEIVLRGLAKEPRKRFQSAREFSNALGTFAVARPPLPPLARRIAAMALDLSLGIMLWRSIDAWLREAWSVEALDLDARGAGAAWACALAGLGGLLVLGFATFEATSGRTPGKRLAELAVESVDGDRPNALQAGMRALGSQGLFFGMLALLVWLGPSTWPAWGLIGLYGTLVGGFLLVTVSRHPERRGWHERWSATRVVDRREAEDVERDLQQVPRARVRAVAPHPVGHYEVRGLLDQTTAGPLYVGRDSALERDVWLLRLDREHETAFGPASTTTDEPGRLREVERLRGGESLWIAFEAVGGAQLERFARTAGRHDWRSAAAGLADLCVVLRGPRPPKSIAELWIDGTRRLRVLPFRIGSPRDADLPPHRLLTSVARLLLTPRRITTSTQSAGLVPLEAQALVARIRSGEVEPQELESIERELRSALQRRATISLGRRRAVLGLTLAPCLLFLLFASALISKEVQRQRLNARLERIDALNSNLAQFRFEGPEATAVRRGLEATREGYLALVGRQLQSGVPSERKTNPQTLALEPLQSPPPEAWEAAHRDALHQPPMRLNWLGASDTYLWFVIALRWIDCWWCLCVLSAFCLRRGLALQLLGVSVVDSSTGRTATRALCAWRVAKPYLAARFLCSFYGDLRLPELQGAPPWTLAMTCAVILLLVLLLLTAKGQRRLDEFTGTHLAPG